MLESKLPLPSSLRAKTWFEAFLPRATVPVAVATVVPSEYWVPPPPVEFTRKAPVRSTLSGTMKPSVHDGFAAFARATITGSLAVLLAVLSEALPETVQAPDWDAWTAKVPVQTTVAFK